MPRILLHYKWHFHENDAYKNYNIRVFYTLGYKITILKIQVIVK